MARHHLSPSLLFAACLGSITLTSGPALGHAEHDKPRYVTTEGRDQGRCDTPVHACRTIAYAAGQASKGDVILVAEGRYTLTNIDQLFHLISGVVPVKGGHSTGEFKADPERYPTFIQGVPPEYVETLTERGFQVIVDTKGLDGKRQQQLQGKLNLVNALKSTHTDLACENGQAGDFSCHQVDLVAHLPLSSLESTEGNDIWGHVDLNDGREYALMGVRNGTAIVDISTPESPQLVTRIPGQHTTWRDIKVLQTWSMEEQRWRAWAYVTADSASVGLQIIDLSGLPESAELVAADRTDLSAHNVYLSNVDYGTGVPLTGLQPYLHMAGSNRNGGAFNTYSLDQPASPSPLYRHGSNARSNYSHDVSSLVIEDERKDTQCLHSGSHCEIMLDYNENEVRLWDKTDNQNPGELGQVSYPLASYVHSGWWTEDKQYMTVHDELDEQRYDINSTMHFFDISDLRNPVLAGTFTGSTSAIDHNGFTRGNRYYMSNYERGLTVLDITDPTAPKEVGYFDTFPISDNASFNGAWGVYPFLPSGLILVSDINSGLYILRDRTLPVAQGSLAFDTAHYSAAEGSDLIITVTRNGGATGAISVGYETQAGATDDADFSAVNGRLSWADGDSGHRQIQIPIAEDANEEVDELLLVRLFDPRGGATLSAPSLATASIAGTPQTGTLSFEPDTLAVRENAAPSSFSLIRQGGNDGTLEVRIITAEDAPFTLEPDTLIWADGESGSQSITLSPIADPEATGDLPFTLELESQPPEAGSNAQLALTLRDLQSNQPPVLSGDAGDQEVTAGDAVTLNVEAADPEGFDIAFHWEQSAGTPVALTGIDSNSVAFTAPGEADVLGFKVTATDDFGASAERVYEITVSASASPPDPAPNDSPNNSGSGGGALGLWLLALLGLGGLLRRRGGC